MSTKVNAPCEVTERCHDWIGVPRGMSLTVAEMLNAVRDAGDDDTPRLVLADAFQEAGYDRQAGFIRRQVSDWAKAYVDNGVRISSPVYWSAPELEEGDANRVTIEGLLNLKPWECRQWYTSLDTRYHRDLSTIQVASAASRRNSVSFYPHVTWHRGFLNKICRVSPQTLFRWVESGAHAWHPWQFGKADSDAAEAHLSCLQDFVTTAFPDADERGYFWRVSYRDSENAFGRVQWHSGTRRPNASDVVPYPIACFMGRGPSVPGEPRRFEVCYRTSSEAIDALNRAMRLFVYHAAQRARHKVIELGGT